jgi:hypothetical protein
MCGIAGCNAPRRDRCKCPLFTVGSLKERDVRESQRTKKKTSNVDEADPSDDEAGARGDSKRKMLEATANELLTDIYKASDDSRKKIGLQAEERHPLPSPTKLSRQPSSRNPQDDDNDGSDDADPSNDVDDEGKCLTAMQRVFLVHERLKNKRC